MPSGGDYSIQSGVIKLLFDVVCRPIPSTRRGREMNYASIRVLIPQLDRWQRSHLSRCDVDCCTCPFERRTELLDSIKLRIKEMYPDVTI